MSLLEWLLQGVHAVARHDMQSFCTLPRAGTYHKQRVYLKLPLRLLCVRPEAFLYHNQTSLAQASVGFHAVLPALSKQFKQRAELHLNPLPFWQRRGSAARRCKRLTDRSGQPIVALEAHNEVGLRDGLAQVAGVALRHAASYDNPPDAATGVVLELGGLQNSLPAKSCVRT